MAAVPIEQNATLYRDYEEISKVEVKELHFAIEDLKRVQSHTLK